MIVMAVTVLVGCGDSGAGGNAGSGGGAGGDLMVPVGNDGSMLTASEAGVRAFAAARRHADWVHEAAAHVSAGPHNSVQIYFNDKYLAARRAGTYPMPVGAMAVKEIFDSSAKHIGNALAVKIAAGEGAQTWLWWEALGMPAATGIYGVAAPTCENCHKGAAARDRSLIEMLPP
jgi:hypothetical protein